MTNPTDVNVLVCTNIVGIARTLRMALRGMGVRTVFLAHDINQLLDGFSVAEPHAIIVYVDGPEANDDGLATLRFIRRSEQCPHNKVPVIAVSPRRDLPTINAVINGGAHEYVLFPAAGDTLVKKITAARTTSRPFIETEAYFGPERKQDRDAAAATAAAEAPPAEAKAG